jgi:hypothetical protein
LRAEALYLSLKMERWSGNRLAFSVLGHKIHLQFAFGLGLHLATVFAGKLVLHAFYPYIKSDPYLLYADNFSFASSNSWEFNRY